jgi:5-methylcytosine-specific restriction endonuclease McrA
VNSASVFASAVKPRSKYGNRDVTKGSPDHRRYLRSASWKALRLLIFKRDGYTCRVCGRKSFDTRKLHAHHLTYDRLGNERMTDLETVCMRCHRRVSTW